MRITVSKPLVFSAVLAIGLLGASPTTRAGSLINGNFTQGADGLFGWNVDPPGSVTVSASNATLHESASASEVDLLQNFTLPTDAVSLSFTLVNWHGENPQGFLPDAFGASLLNPSTLAPLVPTVDSSTDSFYIRDLDPSVPQGEAAPGVTVSPSPSALPLLVTVDLSAVAGQDAQVLFRLIGGGPTPDEASVTLTNVFITTSGPSPVPEPSSLALAALSIVPIASYFGLRHKRAARLFGNDPESRPSTRPGINIPG
jgi:hypothetical protein